MTNPIARIVNATTGEVIEREMNAEELAQHQADLAAQEDKQAEQAAKEAARKSALDKLAALGLTEAEIAAITGA